MKALWPSSRLCCTAPAQHLPASLTSLSQATAAARPWTWGRYALVRVESPLPSFLLTGSYCHSNWGKDDMQLSNTEMLRAWLLLIDQDDILSSMCSDASVYIVRLSWCQMWMGLFESDAVVLFKLILLMLSLNIALASACSSTNDLDSVELNLTQDPFFIFSVWRKGVHTAGSYLI